jgi:hypothetical protein
MKGSVKKKVASMNAISNLSRGVQGVTTLSKDLLLSIKMKLIKTANFLYEKWDLDPSVFTLLLLPESETANDSSDPTFYHENSITLQRIAAICEYFHAILILFS